MKRSRRILELAHLAAIRQYYEDDDEVSEPEENISSDASNYSPYQLSSRESSDSEEENEENFNEENTYAELTNLQVENPEFGESNFYPRTFEFENSLTAEHSIPEDDLKRVRESIKKNDGNTSKEMPSTSKEVPSTSKEVPSTSNETAVDISTPNRDSPKGKSVYDSPFLDANKYKKTYCKFCKDLTDSKHFFRHLKRKHPSEKEVIEILKLHPKSKEKKQLTALLRSEGNLEASSRGHIVPRRRNLNKEANAESYDEECYVPCPCCKGHFMKAYLSRHRKRCFARKEDETGGHSAVMESMIYTACQKKYGKILQKMFLRKEILDKMRGDEVSQEIINDVLIISWGDDLLKKTPSQRSKYHLVAKMRRCANFVRSMRQISPHYTDLLSCLMPRAFDDVVEATKMISKYDPETRTFRAGSTALQFGGSLKQIVDLAIKMLLREKIPDRIPRTNIESALKELKRFKHLVDTQWTIELGSLAMKDLNQKACQKTQLLPLTEDIKKLKDYIEKTAEEAYYKLSQDFSREEEKTVRASFNTLAETTLLLTITHNRKRAGDVHFFQVKEYQQQRENNFTGNVSDEFLQSLSESEKVLTKNYVKLNTMGKGSRGVPVLIPKDKLKYLELIYKLRTTKKEWFLENNNYFFTFVKSTRWIGGTTTIRKYAQKSGAKKPELLTVGRLRKHIATVTQILSLKDSEVKQLADFMGHTQKTHEQFYKLPQDVYQCAKISKLLQMMDKGNIAEFKHKNLDEIVINMELTEDETTDDENETDMPACETKGPLSETNAPVAPHSDMSNTDDEKERGLLVENVVAPEIASRRQREESEDTEHPRELQSRKSRNTRNTRAREGKKTGQRKTWDIDLKQLVLKSFSQNIKKKMFPRKKQIEDFIKKHPDKFKETDFKRIQVLVVNEYTFNK